MIMQIREMFPPIALGEGELEPVIVGHEIFHKFLERNLPQYVVDFANSGIFREAHVSQNSLTMIALI